MPIFCLCPACLFLSGMLNFGKSKAFVVQSQGQCTYRQSLKPDPLPDFPSKTTEKLAVTLSFAACFGSVQLSQCDRNWDCFPVSGSMHTAPQKLLLNTTWGNDLSTHCSHPPRAGIRGAQQPCHRLARGSSVLTDHCTVFFLNI